MNKLGRRFVVGWESGGEFWIQLWAVDLNLEAVSTLMVFKARELDEITRAVSVVRGIQGLCLGAPQ